MRKTVNEEIADLMFSHGFRVSGVEVNLDQQFTGLAGRSKPGAGKVKVIATVFFDDVEPNMPLPDRIGVTSSPITRNDPDGRFIWLVSGERLSPCSFELVGMIDSGQAKELQSRYESGRW